MTDKTTDTVEASESEGVSASGRPVDLIGAVLKTGFLAVQRITDRERSWMTSARSEDRWAVCLEEGWFCTYGPTIGDALEAALRAWRTILDDRQGEGRGNLARDGAATKGVPAGAQPDTRAAPAAEVAETEAGMTDTVQPALSAAEWREGSLS